MRSRVHIQTSTRNGVTRLQQVFCTPPFKVADITEDKKLRTLHCMLMSSSPGILDGDDYHIKVEVAANAQLQLHTQSYQRLFNMKKGAQQQMEVQMQENASFIYIPHPSVPHTQSIFTSRNSIYLPKSSRLLWGEILTCGRTQNGEQFRFTKYHNITDVYVDNRLLIKENLLVQPGAINIHSIGQWEGYTHQASLIAVGTAPDADRIHCMLEKEKELTYGISQITSDTLIIRLLGYKAEQLFNCLNTIAELTNPKAVYV